MKKSLSLSIFFVALLAVVPAFAFAQGTAGDVLHTVLLLLNTVIRILIIAAIAFFIYGVVTYIFKADKEEGRKRIINGLIGLFIIVAFWGIIRIVQNTFNLDGDNSIQQESIPCVQGINC